VTEEQLVLVQPLNEELQTMAREWTHCRTHFYGPGPAPTIPTEPKDWEIATAVNHINRESESEPVDFPHAVQREFNCIRNFFVSRFVPWATEVVSLFGIDRFNKFEIPDPPLHGLPLNSRLFESDVAWISGTPSTSQAGIRIIFWAAASVNPIQSCRSAGFQETVFVPWISELIRYELWGTTTRREVESETKLIFYNVTHGLCRPPHELLNWVQQGFDLLFDPAGKTGSCKNENKRGRPDETDRNEIWWERYKRGLAQGQWNDRSEFANHMEEENKMPIDRSGFLRILKSYEERSAKMQ
jgi:hypothetical protein